MTRARHPRRGEAPLFLLATLVLSCATGVGVYLYLKDHYAHSAKAPVAEASAPRPIPPPGPVDPYVEPAPAAVPVEPPAPVPIVPAPVAETDPEELTVEQVEATIAAARHRFDDCAILGRLTLTVKIRPSGRVEQVTVDGTDSDEMRSCVVGATKRIKFAKSGKGLTARYTLVGG